MAANEGFTERLETYLRQFGRLSAVQPEVWRELDLSMTQFKALLFIWARQPLSVSQVGAALGMRLGTASALVNRLERLGLVSRTENPEDRRQTLVELTPAGQSMLARMQTHAITRARTMFERMSERWREAWTIALEEAVRALESAEDT